MSNSVIEQYYCSCLFFNSAQLECKTQIFSLQLTFYIRLHSTPVFNWVITSNWILHHTPNMTAKTHGTHWVIDGFVILNRSTWSWSLLTCKWWWWWWWRSRYSLSSLIECPMPLHQCPREHFWKQTLTVSLGDVPTPCRWFYQYHQTRRFFSLFLVFPHVSSIIKTGWFGGK